MAPPPPGTTPTLPPMVQPSSWSTGIFVAIVVVLCVLFVYAILRAYEERQSRALLLASPGIGLWLGVTAAVADSGALAPGPIPPPLMLFFGACNLAALGLAFSSVGKRVSIHVPMFALVGFQAFRLPLELVLHRWYTEGVIPVQMTFSGHNFDIVTGILAVVVGYSLWRRKLGRRAALAFNLLGLGLLLTVGTIAVLSSPIPARAYDDDPVLLLAFSSPYVWIVPVCISGALFGHVVALRALWLSRGSPADTGSTSGGV